MTDDQAAEAPIRRRRTFDEHDEPDAVIADALDETVVVRRRSTSVPAATVAESDVDEPGAPDDATVVVRRRRSTAVPAAYLPDTDTDTATADATIVVRRRATAGSDVSATEPLTESEAELDVEHTAIAVGRGRRATGGGDVPAPVGGRTARTPDADEEVYAPRPAGVAMVSRAPLQAPASPDYVDTAAVEGDRRRRARRGILIGVAAGAVVAVGATALLVLLLIP